jgi:U3 small nucleolar RNA-associated protein 25
MGMMSKTKVCELLRVCAHDIDQTAGVVDAYEQHFGVAPSVLSEFSRAAVDRLSWKLSQEQSGQLGITVLSTPEGLDLEGPTGRTAKIDVI